MSVTENIRLPLAIKKEAVDQDWYDQVLATLRLTELIDSKVSALTPSEQQRVACARALITKPALVVADEPTGHLDSDSAVDFLSLLRACVSELGSTIVVATNDASVAVAADQVYFVRDGVVATDITAPTAQRIIDVLRAWATNGPQS
jgi:putative ABC transport system ATP-binding protein